jgi:4-amino-4-deoxy-L-arabinose transferase-like glycosyltransferase
MPTIREQPSPRGSVELIARAAVAAALFARLAGLGRGWLPPAGALGAVLIGLELVWLLRQHVLAGGGWRTALQSVRRNRFALVLAVLCGLSLVVRLTSIGADLGHHPMDIDEFRLANNIRHFFVTGEVLHTTVEHYPGIVFWMLTGASLFAYLQGLLAGVFGSVGSMPVEHFILAGRVANAFVATGTVTFTGLIGRRLGGAGAGLLAALLVGVVPLAIQTTTQMRNDPGQVLLVLAAVWSSLALHDSERRRWAIAAGACAGLATGVKYTSVFALAPPVIAALSVPREHRARCLGWTVLAFGGALAASNHFLWLDFSNFVRQLSDQVGITGGKHWAATDNPAAFHAFVLARFGPGLVLLLLAGAWGALVLARGRGEAWVFWAFPLLYSWFTTSRPAQLPRWVYPLLPFVATAGACGLVHAICLMRRWHRWSSMRNGGAMRTAAATVLVAIAVAAPLWASLVTYSGRLSSSTTGVLEAWLRRKIPAGEAVLVEDGWLDLRGSAFTVVRVPDLGKVLHQDGYALSAADWIVVPETRFANTTLRGLRLVQQVDAQPQTFGGHMGYDYRVYAAPDLAPVGKFELRLDAPDASAALGNGWPDHDGKPGRRLPRTGATVYAPPISHANASLTVEIAGAGASSDPLPVAVEFAGRAISVADGVAEPGLRRLSGVVSVPATGRAIAVRLIPVARNSRIRVMRMRLE